VTTDDVGDYLWTLIGSDDNQFLIHEGTSDDMEHNLSTFLTEMKECAYLLDNLTPRSLVIVDELGRGTSNIDGT
jgi:DNA mismatch repair protein MSH4